MTLPSSKTYYRKIKFWCRLEGESMKLNLFFNPVPSQLLAWPDDVPEAVTVVTIAPDFHGVHHGCIPNLKKFTAYFTSVLCFTTPGDGPPSTPQLIWTHEDSECALQGSRQDPSVLREVGATVVPSLASCGLWGAGEPREITWELTRGVSTAQLRLTDGAV